MIVFQKDQQGYEGINDLYEQARPFINNGDIILFQKKGILPKLIMYFDKAEYTHIGVVWKSNGRLFILDSNEQGVHPDFLSDRINDSITFTVIRVTEWEQNIIDIKVTNLLTDSEGIKYNFLRLLQIAIYNKLNIDLKFIDQKNRDICSQFVQVYTDSFPLLCYSGKKLMTPQDFIRFIDTDEIKERVFL